ncbi:MAG: DUF2155 domain-containing protein [Alphaproteobacteria bacterium]
MNALMRLLGLLAVTVLAADITAGAGRAAEATAELQALDKVTARISALHVPIGGTVHFGTIEVTARSCYKAPPEEPPENAAFLEIHEVRRGEDSKLLFSGWMFSSSPGLSTLEHPVYDVWVVDCRPASADGSADTATGPSSE